MKGAAIDPGTVSSEQRLRWGLAEKNKGQRFEPLPFCLVPLRGAG